MVTVMSGIDQMRGGQRYYCEHDMSALFKVRSCKYARVMDAGVK